MLPLDNIKIVDMTSRAPGTFCSMTLADLGADVLVVEAPTDPDTGGRSNDPAALERAAAYDPLRRNKRSIVLNLKMPEALGVFRQLAKEAGVVMEGNRPGVAQRLSVDYETLKNDNPGLVYCSISGYGQEGPYRLLPGHDVNYISFGGALGVIGPADGTPSLPYNLLGDFAAGGILSAVAILSALWARQRTGQGQFIDMSMTDGALYLMAPVVAAYFSSGKTPEPGKMRLNGGAPEYQAYRCKDGKFVSLGCLEPKFWVNLCTELDRKKLIPRQGEWAVIAELQQVFSSRDRDDWFDLLCDKEVAIAKVLSTDELSSDPQLQNRGMLTDMAGPGGDIPHVGVGPRLTGTPGALRSVGVTPGSHTREVLQQLGYDDATIGRLYDSSTVA